VVRARSHRARGPPEASEIVAAVVRLMMAARRRRCWEPRQFPGWIGGPGSRGTGPFSPW